MRGLLLLILAGCAHTPSAATDSPVRPTSTGGFDWLVGTWVDEERGATERWEPQVAGVMLGSGHSLREDGSLGSFEFLMLDARRIPPVYRAWPNGGAPTDFPLTRAGPGSATFENPAHDFPQRLVYLLDGDSLEVQVQDLEGQGFGLKLRRQ